MAERIDLSEFLMARYSRLDGCVLYGFHRDKGQTPTWALRSDERPVTGQFSQVGTISVQFGRRQHLGSCLPVAFATLRDHAERTPYRRC